MAGRMPIPVRGRPYFDADRGLTLILPKQGGKAVPYVGPREPAGFDADRALRRAGLGARELGRGAADDAAGLATTVGSRSPFDFGAAGGFVIAAGASLLGLLFLDMLLSDKGAKATSGVFGGLGRGVRALVDPAHPLVARTPAEPSRATSTPATAAATAAAVAASGHPDEGTRGPGASSTVLPGSSAQVPGPSGRLAVVPGTGRQLDSAFKEIARAIESAFGVKLTSGYRDPQHNAQVGGAPRSDHLTGAAADFSGSPAAMDRLARWAQAIFPYVEYDPAAIGDTRDPTDHIDHVHISFWRKG